MNNRTDITANNRTDITAALEGPVRRLHASGWTDHEAAAEAESILIDLDTFDADKHMKRRRNFVTDAVRREIGRRVAATRVPLTDALIADCSTSHCSRHAKWTVDMGEWRRLKPSAPPWGRKAEDYETMTMPRPYCGQHAAKAVIERSQWLYLKAMQETVGDDSYAPQIATLDDALRLARIASVEIDPADIEAVA